MKIYVIRAFAHPCSALLYLQVEMETGKTRFIVKHIRGRKVEKVALSTVATKEILAEIDAKSVWNVRYGIVLQTIIVSSETKEFINSCWKELKNLQPQLCIKD